jgi:FKBP-type peptidyl-prolyl cis-trans isomerase FkpA
MKKGGKATLIIPAALAYGENAAANIPAFTSLVFEVELMDVK